MADARSRNELLIASLLKPPCVCTAMGPDCFVGHKACSALSASLLPR